MAYDRHDTRGGSRERWRSDDRYDRERGDRRSDERGFFERAGDEIASWFGDEEAERRRREDERMHGRDDDYGRPGRERGDDRGAFFGRERGGFGDDRGRTFGSGWDSDRDRDRDRYRGRSESRGRGWFGSDRDRDRHEDRTRPIDWSRSERSYGRSDRDRGERGERGGYRPITGDYGRSEGLFAASGYGRGGYDRDEDRDFDRSRSEFGNDEYRRTSFAGSREQSNYDPHYDSWRRRQMDELDRDYDEYRRENQSRFEDDFSSWRERRTQKRGLLGQIREHMEVVGKDDEHVGTVDRVAGDRIILTKSDPESGGVHHSLSCTDIDRVEDDRVILDCSAEKARERWRDESRGRALFEREDQGEAGPHGLERSFSGTYR